MPTLNSDSDVKKLFYNIGEVSKQLELASSLLRFWEKEFDCLQKVVKNKKGDRKYTEHNIEDLKQIVKLVKQKGYTLQGANQIMNKSTKSKNPQQDTLESLSKIRDFLESLKNSL